MAYFSMELEINNKKKEIRLLVPCDQRIKHYEHYLKNFSSDLLEYIKSFEHLNESNQFLDFIAFEELFYKTLLEHLVDLLDDVAFDFIENCLLHEVINEENAYSPNSLSGILDFILEKIYRNFIERNIVNVIIQAYMHKMELIALYFPESIKEIQLVRIIPTSGDRHAYGKQVLILEFKNKINNETEKVVYRPTSVTPQLFFNGNTEKLRELKIFEHIPLSLCETLNSEVGLLKLPTLIVYPCRNFKENNDGVPQEVMEGGFVEYVSQFPDNIYSTHEKIEKFINSLFNDNATPKLEGKELYNRLQQEINKYTSIAQDSLFSSISDARKQMKYVDYCAFERKSEEDFYTVWGRQIALCWLIGLYDLHNDGNVIVKKCLPNCVDAEVLLSYNAGRLGMIDAIHNQHGAAICFISTKELNIKIGLEKHRFLVEFIPKNALLTSYNISEPKSINRNGGIFLAYSPNPRENNLPKISSINNNDNFTFFTNGFKEVISKINNNKKLYLQLIDRVRTDNKVAARHLVAATTFYIEELKSFQNMIAAFEPITIILKDDLELIEILSSYAEIHRLDVIFRVFFHLINGKDLEGFLIQKLLNKCLLCTSDGFLNYLLDLSIPNFLSVDGGLKIYDGYGNLPSCSSLNELKNFINHKIEFINQKLNFFLGRISKNNAPVSTLLINNLIIKIAHDKKNFDKEISEAVNCLNTEFTNSSFDLIEENLNKLDPDTVFQDFVSIFSPDGSSKKFRSK